MAHSLKDTRVNLMRSGWSVPAARVVEAGLCALLAWIAAQALWFIIYGTDALNLTVAAPSGSPAAATLFAGRGPAGAAAGLFDPLETAETPAQTALPESQLNMTLRGVINSVGGAGSAVIETPGRGQRSLAVGAEIAPGVRLEAIHLDHVIINRRGTRESLFLTEAAAQRARQAREAGPRPGGRAMTAASGAFSEAASPLSGRPDRALAATLDREDWIDGLRLEPVLRGGGVVGLRVREASAIEVLRASGLLPGDVIVRLNGETLNSARAGAAALQALSAADRVVAQVRRGDEEITLEAPLP